MISTTSEYALRALSCLARTPEGEFLLGRDLAERADVPSNYLAKILLELKRAGLVSATRGAGGGYRLAKAPGEVPLAAIVEVFDGPCDAPRCLLGSGRACSSDDPCSFHWKWRRVRRTYALFLETTTLDEVIATSSLAGGRPVPAPASVPAGGPPDPTTTPGDST